MEPSDDKTDYISRLSTEEHTYAKEYGTNISKTIPSIPTFCVLENQLSL